MARTRCFGWTAVLLLFAAVAVAGVQASVVASRAAARAGAWVDAGASAQGANAEDVPRISQADFKALRATGNVLVVDVRDVGSYRAGHIPGAVSIPLEDLQAHFQELKASKKPIVTYCG